MEGFPVRVSNTYIDLDIGHKNPITGKQVIFRVTDDGNDFASGNEESEFSMIVRKDKIKIIADGSLKRIGPFYLQENK